MDLVLKASGRGETWVCVKVSSTQTTVYSLAAHDMEHFTAATGLSVKAQTSICWTPMLQLAPIDEWRSETTWSSHVHLKNTAAPETKYTITYRSIGWIINEWKQRFNRKKLSEELLLQLHQGRRHIHTEDRNKRLKRLVDWPPSESVLSRSWFWFWTLFIRWPIRN